MAVELRGHWTLLPGTGVSISPPCSKTTDGLQFFPGGSRGQMGPGSPSQARSGPSLTLDTDQSIQPRESSRLRRVAALTPWRPASSPGLSSVSRGVICWSSGESFRENTAQSFQAEKSDFCLEGERQDPHIWGLEETLKTMNDRLGPRSHCLAIVEAEGTRRRSRGHRASQRPPCFSISNNPDGCKRCYVA